MSSAAEERARARRTQQIHAKRRAGGRRLIGSSLTAALRSDPSADIEPAYYRRDAGSLSEYGMTARMVTRLASRHAGLDSAHSERRVTLQEAGP
jgi:hypothetical protein